MRRPLPLMPATAPATAVAGLETVAGAVDAGEGASVGVDVGVGASVGVAVGVVRATAGEGPAVDGARGVVGEEGGETEEEFGGCVSASADKTTMGGTDQDGGQHKGGEGRVEGDAPSNICASSLTPISEGSREGLSSTGALSSESCGGGSSGAAGDGAGAGSCDRLRGCRGGGNGDGELPSVKSYRQAVRNGEKGEGEDAAEGNHGESDDASAGEGEEDARKERKGEEGRRGRDGEGCGDCDGGFGEIAGVKGTGEGEGGDAVCSAVNAGEAAGGGSGENGPPSSLLLLMRRLLLPLQGGKEEEEDGEGEGKQVRLSK